MAYCPKCLVEYAEGSPECIDCRVALQSGAPPASAGAAEGEIAHDVKLVTIRVFSGRTAPMEAEMAKNRLESEGIPCALGGANAARLLHALDVSLMVREEDAEEAARVLKEYAESDQAPADEEPS